METNYYIYCVTSKPENNVASRIQGLEDEEVITISYRDICAYVSRTIQTHYDPNLSNLQLHEKVIGRIMKYYTALPLSFSTISKNETDVIKMLSKYYTQFKENLKKVEGKVELGIKVFFKLNFEKEDKEDKIQCKTGKDYIAKRYERYLERKKQTEVILSTIDVFHDNLCKISVESCYSNPMKNNLIFNASYLVDKEKVSDFTEYVLKEEEKYSEYKIIYSGPWSPYHFVKIIKEGDEVE